MLVRSLFVDHPRGIRVAAIMGCETIGIDKDRRHYLRNVLRCFEIPEPLQNLDVPVFRCPHLTSGDQFCERSFV